MKLPTEIKGRHKIDWVFLRDLQHKIMRGIKKEHKRWALLDEKLQRVIDRERHKERTEYGNELLFELEREHKKLHPKKKWKYYTIPRIRYIPKRIIQRVYEDNIKKYGTLTCYLCEEPIEFGQDNLEHKIPIARGGNNRYENLAIACWNCNIAKGTRTVDEFKAKKL